MENYYFKHPSHFGDMFDIFEDFYRNKTLSDVIITCQGKNIHAHRMVLSAGSDYFRKLLTSIKIQNHLPVLFITDISYQDVEIILEFIYRGQIVVSRDKVESLRQAAFKLRVRGFENFLRKTFYANNNGAFSGSGPMRIANGHSRGTSLLNQDSHKRFLKQINEIEMKKLKMSHNSNAPERMIYNNKNIYFNKDEMNRLANHNHHSSPQLAAALQRDPNGVKKMIQEHYSYHLKRNIYDANGTLDLKIEKPKPEIADSVTITPIQNNEPSPSEPSGNSSLSESCDENEDNQKNESTENTMGKMNGIKDDGIGSKENILHDNVSFTQENGNCENGNSDNNKMINNNQQKEDYESEDSREINYTYEMDPNALANWAGSDENVNYGIRNSEEFDGMDEEEYFETYVRNGAANGTPRVSPNGTDGNGQQIIFFCEHCPKYFFDEDHLQVHNKRIHDLNKMNQCDICGKAYAWKSGLYKHKRHVHNISGISVKPILSSSSNDNMMPESPNNSQPPTPTSTPQSSFEALKIANISKDNQSLDDCGQIAAPITPTAATA